MKHLIALLLGLFVACQLAWGHAALLSTDPSAAQLLDTAPNHVILRFNQAVESSALQLLDPQGQITALKPSQQGPGDTMDVALPSSVGKGTYLFSWRVISADGHPVGGTLDWSVGTASAMAGVTSPATAPGLDAAIWLTRWLTWLCVFASVGARFFQHASAPVALPWAGKATAAGLALLLLNLGLQGLDMQGAPWSGLLHGKVWAAALGSDPSWTWGLLALVLLLAWAMARPQHPSGGGRTLLAWGLPLLTGVALALNGHAVDAEPRWLAQPALALHVMTIVVWVGSLLPLAAALRTDSPANTLGARRTSGRSSAPAGEAVQFCPISRYIDPLCASKSNKTGLAFPLGSRRSPKSDGLLGTHGSLEFDGLSRFSGWIMPVVLLLVTSGCILALFQLVVAADLWDTAWGRVLSAKLILVAVLLLVASHNRFVLTHPALEGQARAIRRLRRSIGVEVALVALILALVALWRFTPPPHSLYAANPSQILVSARVAARITPPRRSGAAWDIRLTHPDGKPFAAETVNLVLRHADDRIEPVERAAKALEPGRWRAEMPVVGVGQAWQTQLIVDVDGHDRVALPVGADTGLPQPHHHH